MTNATERALPIVAIAIAFGLLGQLLFFGVGFGINFLIAVAALLLAAWLAPRPRPRMRLVEAWLPIGALGFAAMVAVRGDRTLAGLDALGSLALTGASIAALGGITLVDRPLGRLAMTGLRVVVSAVAGAAATVAAATRRVAFRSPRNSLGPWGGILRGVLIAVPIALVFVALFSAADAVFAEWTRRVFSWDLGDLGGRTVLALVLAWIAAGLLAFSIAPGESDAEEQVMRAWDRRPRIGHTEAVTVLVTLDAVFVAFVILQAAYLFGGRDTLAETGLTYAEYARRGFFELLAVAFLVGGLVLTAESFVRSRTIAYRAAAIGLVALTVVVLASALLRLRLYQDAYGWTELRFYVLAAIFWLAIGAAMAVATILTGRSGWLLHGMLALSIAFGIGINAIGPAGFVADRNVDRGLAANELDVDYVISLGSDAVPAVLRWLTDKPLPPQVSQRFVDEMASASGLDDPANHAWQAWNLSREHARQLLDR